MKDSKEFAGELFDALARRRGISGTGITKAELKEFWEQILIRALVLGFKHFLTCM